MGYTISLDTVVASLCYFLPKWTPALQRTASLYLLQPLYGRRNVCPTSGPSDASAGSGRRG